MWCYLTLIAVAVSVYLILDWIFHQPKIRGFKDLYVIISNSDDVFGKQLSQSLDLLGFHVFAGCQTESGKKLISEACSSRVMPSLLDVTKEESVQEFLKFVKEKLPKDKGIWAVVNNVNKVGNVADTELLNVQDFSEIMELYVLAQVDMVRTFLPLLRKSHGRVINISSGDSNLALSSATEAVSRAGVEAFSTVLRRELYRQGVNVSVVEPAGFQLQPMNVPAIIDSLKTSISNTCSKFQGDYDSDFLAGMRGRLDSFKNNQATNLDPVVDAFTHAITARLPRVKYVVGSLNVRLYNKLAFFLPEWLGDRVVTTMKAV